MFPCLEKVLRINVPFSLCHWKPFLLDNILPNRFIANPLELHGRDRRDHSHIKLFAAFWKLTYDLCSSVLTLKVAVPLFCDHQIPEASSLHRLFVGCTVDSCYWLYVVGVWEVVIPATLKRHTFCLSREMQLATNNDFGKYIHRHSHSFGPQYIFVVATFRQIAKKNIHTFVYPIKVKRYPSLFSA